MVVVVIVSHSKWNGTDRLSSFSDIDDVSEAEVQYIVAKLAFSLGVRIVSLDGPASSHVALIHWGSVDRYSSSAALMV